MGRCERGQGHHFIGNVMLEAGVNSAPELSPNGVLVFSISTCSGVRLSRLGPEGFVLLTEGKSHTKHGGEGAARRLVVLESLDVCPSQRIHHHTGS